VIVYTVALSVTFGADIRLGSVLISVTSFWLHSISPVEHPFIVGA